MSVVFGAGADVSWNVHSSASDGSGRRSARWETGLMTSSMAPALFRWRGKFTNGSSSGTLGKCVFLYLIEATNATGAADEGPMDHNEGSMTADQRRNLTPFGYIMADDVTAGAAYRKWAYFETNALYLQVACFNDLGVSLSTTSGDHWVELRQVGSA